MCIRDRAQVHRVLALGIQADKAVYVNAIFVILVHVGLVRIGQGHRNMYRSEDAVDLSLPFMGFYGNWSDAKVFDIGWYYEGQDLSLIHI